jgi:plasmid stabilization system protein ParE
VFRLEWTERGLQEFESALAFIAEDNPFNAQLVKDRTFKTIGHLEFFSLGTPAPNGSYKIYVPKTSYFLIFRRNTASDIKICAFIHASRDWEKIDWDNV